MNPYAIAPLISFILLAACGFYVVRKGARRIFNWLFAFSIFVLAIMEFGNFMALISPQNAAALFWQRWVFAGIAILPFSWLVLSLTFGRENFKALLKKWLWYLGLLFVITLAFLSLIIRESLIKSAPNWRAHFIVGPIGRYLLIFFLLHLILALLNFEKTYRFSYGKQRDKIKWAIRGFSLFLWVYIILSSLALLFSYIDTRFAILGSLAIIAGTIICAYSIRRHGLADVEVYIGRQAVYTSATITVIGIYLVLVGLVTKLFMIWGLNLKAFFSFLCALFVFFIFLYLVFSKVLKHRLQLFIDRTIYKGKYDYKKEWAQINRRISSILELDKLSSTIAQTISEALNVKRILIMLLNDDKSEYFVAEATGIDEESVKEVRFKKDSEFADWLWRSSEPLLIETAAKSPDIARIYAAEEKKFRDIKAQVVVPLIAKQSLIGMLIVGDKPSRESFTGEDLELLKRIAEPSTIAILNAKLSEELIISKEIESFYKVSSFLIHDLKNFASMLSLVAENARNNFDKPEFRSDALNTLSHTVSRMNNLVQKLSTLPKKLEIKPRLSDLNSIVAEALAKSRIEDAKQIRLVKDLNGSPRVMADSEYMEKVVLNLILNAMEAMPQGGQIKISSQQNNQFAQLIVSDAGCGMSAEFINKHLFKPFQSTKSKGLGIGLFQCKTIVEAHKGRIDVESEEGKGTTFKLTLPINGDGYRDG